jgi:hypothetical protein
MQESELQQDEEQENYHRAAGIEKILPVLPETPTAPRDEVTRKTSGNRFFDSLYLNSEEGA